MKNSNTAYKTYKDANGLEYKIGDIVFNNGFGDVWLVTKHEDEEMLQLDLWGNPDQYYIGVDEPSGFEIISRVGDKDYNERYEEMIRIGKKIEEEENGGN